MVDGQYWQVRRTARTLETKINGSKFPVVLNPLRRKHIRRTGIAVVVFHRFC